MKRLNKALGPGARIGILGGGQLGRMTAVAASRLGLRTTIFAPDEDCIAAEVADERIDASFEDETQLQQFAARCDVITLEFENVPARCLEFLGHHCPVAPGPEVLHVTQDRLLEKRFVKELGIGVAGFHAVDCSADLASALAQSGHGGILKTRRLGYDGKGQVRLKTGDDCEAAWSTVGQAPSIFEEFVDFSCEVSVITARSWSGSITSFPPVENRHENGILAETVAPAGVDAGTGSRAVEIAEAIAEAFEIVGLIAVEMFVLRSGEILVNEMAPRPHNSGHWTIDACAVSQFEQALRAICDWPLGDCQDFANARMRNLIGEQANDWQDHLKDPGAQLHLYGKKAVRPGRKMGHVTWVERGHNVGEPQGAA